MRQLRETPLENCLDFCQKSEKKKKEEEEKKVRRKERKTRTKLQYILHCLLINGFLIVPCNTLCTPMHVSISGGKETRDLPKSH